MLTVREIRTIIQIIKFDKVELKGGVMYLKIKSALVELGITQNKLALILHISPNQLSGKMNGKYDWKKREIDEILRITNKKYEDIF